MNATNQSPSRTSALLPTAKATISAKPMAHYPPEHEGGEAGNKQGPSVGRSAASDSPRSKTPDQVIGLVGNAHTCGTDRESRASFVSLVVALTGLSCIYMMQKSSYFGCSDGLGSQSGGHFDCFGNR